MVGANFAMNLFDLIVYSVFFIVIAVSLYRGFISEMMSLVTWFGAGFITLLLASRSSAYMMQYVESKFGASLIGIMGTYFIAVIVLGLFTRVMTKYLKNGSDVGFLDNALGGMFGAIKGSLIVSLGFLMMTLVYREEGYPEWVQTSSTLPMVQEGSLLLVRLMPEYLGTISSLDPDESMYMNPPPVAQIDQGMNQEFTPIESPQEQPQNKLEHLILDLTQNRQ
ncbi:MAG: CvpA family protein [Alphaproteobacteria bacterium]|nr:MAG: CvpA family protein [Alphaproteobacteria bacterium]TAF76698.1 MAG: CvpA family protein [Alphaproteobacteria bacterium]